MTVCLLSTELFTKFKNIFARARQEWNIVISSEYCTLHTYIIHNILTLYITASFILFQGNIIFPSLKQNLPHRCVQEILGVFHLALGKKTFCRSLGAEKNQWTNHIWGEEKFENFRGRGKKFIRVLEQKKCSYRERISFLSPSAF